MVSWVVQSGVIITLLFFYLTGAAIIFGAEINAALEATPRLQDDPPGTDQVASVSATVVSTTTDEVSGNTIVNVATASEDSAGLAALAATGRIALILDGAGE